jgi:hypothetical protein
VFFCVAENILPFAAGREEAGMHKIKGNLDRLPQKENNETTD